MVDVGLKITLVGVDKKKNLSQYMQKQGMANVNNKT